MDDPAAPLAAPDFLAGGGVMGALMRGYDWAATPVGPPQGWPQTLKTTARLMLTSRHPMFIWWGEALTCFYNDAYSAAIGPDRHPSALGRPGREVWAEIWDVIGPEIKLVMSGQAATWHERQLIPITRGDAREDVWWTYGFSPIDDDDAASGVGGVLVICRDVTAEVGAEQAKADEAGRLRGFFEQAPGFMALLRGPDHLFELANAAYVSLVGRGVQGKAVRDALPEVEGQGFFKLLDQVYATGVAFTARRAPITLASGPNGASNQRFVNFVYQPIRDADGAVSGIFVEGSDVTEATLAESALRASEARLARMLEATPAGIVELDAAARFTYANAAAERALGAGPGGLIGKRYEDPVWHIADADDGTPVPPEHLPGARALGGEPVLDYEHALTALDGRRAVLLVDTVPVHDEEGRVEGALAAFQDVTARHAQARALRESEERLRLVIESASDYAILTTDSERRVTSWSAGAAAVFGYAPDEIMGRSADLLFTPEDCEAGAPVREAELARVEGRAPDVRWHQRRDGARVFLNGSVRLLRDGTGRELGLLKIARDDTEQRRAEERRSALLELGDRLRDLTDPADLAHAAAETLGRTLGVSRAGYGTVDIAAETISIERDWNAPGIRSLAGVLQFRDYGSYIEDLKRGESVVFADAETDPRTSATAAALKAISARAVVNIPVTEQGGLVALLYLNHATVREWPAYELAFVRDVAERTRTAIARRLAEQELRILAESLERKVEERTAELITAEASLHQAQKMEAVGQLTGGIAHDFNNMLQAISGSLELVQRRIDQGRVAEMARFMESARQTTARAAALTHRLLAFARRQTLQPKPVIADTLILAMEDLLRQTVGPAITVELRLCESTWPVLCDPNQLESALLNLAINARDAMPVGGQLTITTQAVHLSRRDVADQEGAAPGDFVEIAVSDTGTGMDEATRARALEPFFTTKPIGQGTGLGLSQLYGFVRQSDGVLRLDSAPGRGTTVRVFLPRQEHARANEEPAAPNVATSKSGTGETVLLVEDEAEVRATTAEHLRDLGYVVLEARDGPAALRLLRSGEPVDLLVTDVGLPGGLNGRQVADAARERRPGLPALFITGYAGNALQDHLASGMDVIGKPFSLDAFVARIRAMLDAASVRSGPEPV